MGNELWGARHLDWRGFSPSGLTLQPRGLRAAWLRGRSGLHAPCSPSLLPVSRPLSPLSIPFLPPSHRSHPQPPDSRTGLRQRWASTARSCGGRRLTQPGAPEQLQQLQEAAQCSQLDARPPLTCVNHDVVARALSRIWPFQTSCLAVTASLFAHGVLRQLAEHAACATPCGVALL